MNNSERIFNLTFAKAFSMSFLVGITFASNAVYPLYVEHTGGGAAEIGRFMSVYFLSGVLARPLIGWMIDRWGVNRVLLMSNLLMALPPLGFFLLLDQGLSPLVWGLRVAQGLGNAGHFTAYFTLAGQNAPQGRLNETIGKYGLAGLSAFMVGPPLGEWVVKGFGLSEFFLVMFAFGMVSVFITLNLPKAEERDTDSPPPSVKGMLTVFKSLRMWFVFFLGMAVNSAFSAAVNFLAPIAEERGISEFGPYFTALGITALLVRTLGASWGDRFGARRMLVPAFLLYVAAMGVLHFSQTTLHLVAGGILAGLAHGTAFPLATTLAIVYAPPRYKGSAMAMHTGVMDMAIAVSAFVLGGLAADFGYGVVFPLSGLLPLLAALAIVADILRKPGRVTQ
ncbi:MFS transporter [bacterium]|nr:MFS transporter [bacterium]